MSEKVFAVYCPLPLVNPLSLSGWRADGSRARQSGSVWWCLAAVKGGESGGGSKSGRGMGKEGKEMDGGEKYKRRTDKRDVKEMD